MTQDQGEERAVQTTQFDTEEFPYTRHEAGGAGSARITLEHEESASEREGEDTGRHRQREAPATTQSSPPSNFLRQSPLAEAGGAKTASEAARGHENDASACEESASETFKKDASRHIQQEPDKQSCQPPKFSRESQRQAAAVSGSKGPEHEKPTLARNIPNSATPAGKKKLANNMVNLQGFVTSRLC